MQGLVELIRYFYEQWILRDVLGYVTPGAVVFVVVALQYEEPGEIVSTLSEIPFVAYIPIYGLLFIMGFALQNLGEMVGLIRWHSRGADADEEQLQRLEEFHQATMEDSRGWLERTRERISVKKNMSGTASMAIIISLVFVLHGLVTEDQMSLNITVIVLSIFLFLSLLFGHTRQRYFQMFWEDSVIDSNKKADSENLLSKWTP